MDLFDRNIVYMCENECFYVHICRCFTVNRHGKEKMSKRKMQHGDVHTCHERDRKREREPPAKSLRETLHKKRSHHPIN